MTGSKTAVLGVGNILEYDDGVAVYASAYLEANYTFEPAVRIINGGVEGINLLDIFIEHEHVLVLDAIEIDDLPGSIYHIPSSELTGYGLNSGGAHEIGVMQCIDMLELMGKPLPESSVVGIVPERVEVRMGLSKSLVHAFERYIAVIL
ncbi:MAG: hydrogenase maturation protease, partial [Campylobacterales bacterium]